MYDDMSVGLSEAHFEVYDGVEKHHHMKIHNLFNKFNLGLAFEDSFIHYLKIEEVEIELDRTTKIKML